LQVVVADSGVRHPKIPGGGGGGEPVTRSKLLSTALNLCGGDYGRLGRLTDDQFMHLLGVDLDELYAKGGDDRWAKIFRNAAAEIGIEPSQLTVWPRKALVAAVEKAAGESIVVPIVLTQLHRFTSAL
jgi:hypothetical protein